MPRGEGMFPGSERGSAPHRCTDVALKQVGPQRPSCPEPLRVSTPRDSRSDVAFSAMVQNIVTLYSAPDSSEDSCRTPLGHEVCPMAREVLPHIPESPIRKGHLDSVIKPP